MAIRLGQFHFGSLIVLASFTLGLGNATFVRAENTPNIGEIATKIEPSVVVVKTNTGLGSGFVIDSAGRVATNFHVIENAHRAVAQFKDGNEMPLSGWSETLGINGTPAFLAARETVRSMLALSINVSAGVSPNT